MEPSARGSRPSKPGACTTVVVSSSTISAGPGNAMPGASAARSMTAPVGMRRRAGSITSRVPDGRRCCARRRVGGACGGGARLRRTDQVTPRSPARRARDGAAEQRGIGRLEAPRAARRRRRRSKARAGSVDGDLVALAAIAHEGGAALDQRGRRRASAHDRFGLGAHLGEQRVHGSRVEAHRAAHVRLHRLVGDRRAQEADAPSPRPRRSAPRTRSMPSFSRSRAACSGAAPPKAIIVRSAVSLPFSTACTRAAFAMFSSTISPMPKPRPARREAERFADLAARWRAAALGVDSRIEPPAKRAGIEPAQHAVGIGDGRPRAAAPVAGGAGLGAGAVRADLDAAQRIDARDGAAAGADLDHLDHRDAQRQAAALHEAIGARDLEWSAHGAARNRSIRHDLRRRAAHVEGDARASQPVLGRDRRRQDRAAGRAGFDQAHGKALRRLDRGQRAARTSSSAAGSATPSSRNASVEPAEIASPSAAAHRRWRRWSTRARIRGSRARPRTRGRRTGRALLREDLARAALMRGVEIGVQEADRDSLDAARAQLPARARAAPPRPAAAARCPSAADALGHAEAQRGAAPAARGVRSSRSYWSKRCSKAISIESRKPSVVMQRRPRALALDQRVGGERGAVDDEVEPVGRDAGLGEDLRTPLDDAFLRRARAWSAPCRSSSRPAFPARCR